MGPVFERSAPDPRMRSNHSAHPPRAPWEHSAHGKIEVMIDEIKHTPTPLEHWFGGRLRNVQLLSDALDGSDPFAGLSAYRERLLRDRIDGDLDDAKNLLDLLGDYPEGDDVLTHFMTSRILDQLSYRQMLLST